MKYIKHIGSNLSVGVLTAVIAGWSVFYLTTPLPADAQTTCPSGLVTIHNNYLTQYKSTIQTQAASGDGATYYFTSYYLHGMISAIECTKNETELQLLVSLINTMISKAQDFNSDGYYEWAPLDSLGRPTQLNSWQAESAIARAAALIMNDSGFKTKYGTNAQAWINFVHEDVIERWYVDTYGEKIPYVEWGIANSFPERWSDKATHFLTISLFMYKATGNTYYRDIALRPISYFRYVLCISLFSMMIGMTQLAGHYCIIKKLIFLISLN